MFEAQPQSLYYEQEQFYRDEMDMILSGKAKQCDVCNQRMKMEEFESLCGCEHEFCKDCLKYYVLYKVKNEFVEIDCPKEGCKKKLDKKCSVFQELPDNLKYRYKRIEVNIKTMTHPTQRLCPDCGETMCQVENQPNYLCKVCVKKFCKKCLNPPHSDRITCDRQAAAFMKFNFKYHRCPYCSFIVEKSQGCNYMACKCGHSFCYKCGGKWKNYEEHECKKVTYVRPRSYHVVKRELPVRQSYAVNVTNLTFVISGKEEEKKPKGHRMPLMQAFLRSKKASKQSSRTKATEGEEVLVGNLSQVSQKK